MASPFLSANASDDEYTDYNFDDLTEEDLRRVDAHVEARLGEPKVTIELPPGPGPGPGSSSEETPVSQRGVSPSASEFDHEEGDAGVRRKKREDDLDRLADSPLARHRRNGVLSVTDLASLAWCEVQFDYGLRQRRSMPIASRPQSFVSAQGKTIVVAKEVAVANDKITKQGKALHRALEREVKPEEFKVDISSPEEVWALRLVNMLESLRGIVLEGYTRELPVFGILQGEVVIGVIDEVVLKNEVPLIPQKRASDFSESPGKKVKKQRRARALSPSQHLLPEYLPAYVSTDPPAQHDPVALSNSVTASMEMKAVGAKYKEVGRRPSTPDEPPPPAPALPAPPPVPIEVDFPESKFKEAIRPSTLNQLLPPTPKPGPPRRYLHLVDTKTRQKKSLPSDKDTLPSRMQLMLYHRLLKEMISISPPFDFAAMWEHLGVDPTATFSTAFLVQAGLLDKDWGMPCLNALSEAFIGMVLDLDLAGIDTNLELVYRLRGSKVKFGRGKGKSKSEEGTGKKRRASPPVVTQEEHDIARAIETSLLDACASAGPTVPETSTSGSGQFEPVLNLQTPSDSETFLDPLAVQFTTGEVYIPPKKAGTTIRPSSSRSSSVSEVDRHELTPIGTKEFQYEEETLDHHITNALRFWHGTREPQGVSIEDSWRCRTCEYENNCEWREKKAEEDQERRMQARRQC